MSKRLISCKFTPKHIMARQSISITTPNDEWLKAQIDSKEYASKSEIVNDLIRQARLQQRQIDSISPQLGNTEQNGLTNDDKKEILEHTKTLING